MKILGDEMEIKINGPKLEKIANELKNIYFDIEESVEKLEQLSDIVNESDFKTITNNNPIIKLKNKNIKEAINSDKDFLPKTIQDINLLFDDLESNNIKSFQIKLGDSYENKN